MKPSSFKVEIWILAEFQPKRYWPLCSTDPISSEGYTDDCKLKPCNREENAKPLVERPTGYVLIHTHTKMQSTSVALAHAAPPPNSVHVVFSTKGNNNNFIGTTLVVL